MLLLFSIPFFALFAKTVSSLLCFIPGECVSNPYSLIEKNTMEECIHDCSKSNICIWTTFNPKNNYCSFFDKICTEIDDSSCPICLTSEKNCTVSKIKHIMVK